MKHLKLIAILIAAFVVVSLFVSWLGREDPVAVVVHKVGVGTVQSSVANTRAGTVKACRRAGLSPAVGGQIAELPVKEGFVVSEGQLLMALWNDDQMAQLDLTRREAEAAKAGADQACIIAEVAAKEAERLEKLMESKLTSEEMVDMAVGEARADRAACEAAQARYEVARARIDVMQAALERTRLVAPFAGVVAEVNGEIGEFVTPSPVGIPTPPAVDLMDVGCLYVSAPIDEVDAPQIRVGMTARISLDAMAGKIFDGEVRRIAPYVLELEKQARTVDVEVDFFCTDDCLNMLPGYSADIEVILEQRDKVLRIPSEAILEGNRVLLLDDDELREKRIEVGLSNWAWSEVSAGLKEGDEVVVSVERDGVVDGAVAEREAVND